MKFGETFMEYLHRDGEGLLGNCSHVEYKRLKKVLKRCRNCRASEDSNAGEEEDRGSNALSRLCQCPSCPVCDQMFFSELMKEASDVAGCFRARVRHLLHLHLASGVQKYLVHMYQCFITNQQSMVKEGSLLVDYVMMNAIAMRKILKKYDKVHRSAKGMSFKSKMRSEHMEILQSPWLIELGAFCMNLNESKGGDFDDFSRPFSCDLSATGPLMTLTLPDSVKLEYSLTCAICLDIVFNPYALSCGHLFCKSCACSAASVMIFKGIVDASPESKCPVCREVGVYGNAVRMIELNLLLKKRCKEYWKQRHTDERAEMVKQSKEFWDLQTKYTIGY